MDKLVNVSKAASAAAVKEHLAGARDWLYQAKKLNPRTAQRFMDAAMSLGRATALITIRENAGLNVESLDKQADSLFDRMGDLANELDARLDEED